MNHRFSQRERVGRKRDFDRVFQRGRVFKFEEIILRAIPNDLPQARLGISISKRHGTAVRRNRMKRLLREAFRLNKQILSVPCDIAVVPRNAWRDLSLAAIEPTLRKALSHIEKAFASGQVAD